MDSQTLNQAPQQLSNFPPPPPVPQPLQGETFKGNIKPFLFITLSIIILVSIFALSFFYFANQKQPQLQTRAALPTQAINLKISPTNSQTIPTQIPTQSTNNVTMQPFSTDSPQPTAPVYTPVPEEIQVSSPQEAPKDAVRAIFDISAKNNAFTPKHLTAYINQVVVIYFTAIDHNYDVTIPSLNLKKTVKQGQKSALEFQAQNFGEYVFECSENCNNSPEAKGLLFIKPL